MEVREGQERGKNGERGEAGLGEKRVGEEYSVFGVVLTENKSQILF